MLWQNSHPFPSRSKNYLGDLMSLSTITSKDAPLKARQFKVLKQRQIGSLSTEDIPGTKPLLRGYQCTNKPEYSNSTSDIEKCCPKQLHRALNKPSYNLMTSDIDKAKPRQGEFITSRVTNPLNPVYKLPSFEVRPITPPKFIRDSIPSNDIEGARPEIYHKWTMRDCISVRDIEGARPKPEKLLEKPNFMDPKDINGAVFQTKRVTNPLEPEYIGRDPEGNIVTIGNIEGTKSKKIINPNGPGHKRNLDSSDIDGARPNTVGPGPFGGSKERNYIKCPVDSTDIIGTTSGSHKIGIFTKRVTNPLEPKYAWSTGEPAIEPAKPIQKEVKNEELCKNTSKFWGVTPANSRTNSLPPSRPSTSRPSSHYALGFQKSLYKFYDQSLPPDLQQEEIKASAEKFYSNSSVKIADKFISVQNPNTIHRIKKQVPVVNMLQFNQNVKNFCGVDSDRNSRPYSSQGSYKFGLSRSEIAKPVI